MGIRLSRYLTKTALFFSAHRKALRYLYVVAVVLILFGVVVYPVYLNLANPQMDVFVGRTEFNRQFAERIRPYVREMGRMGDFAVFAHNIWENYPFFAMAERTVGVDVDTVGMEAFEYLQEVAQFAGDRLFLDFLDNNFIQEFGGLGGLRLSTEGSAMPRWFLQPYFFGYYDWRFFDERAVVYTRDYNFTTQTLAGGIAYMRVNSFLPKGYEAVSRRPFWHFDFGTERARVLEFYQSLYGYDDLVIDIRGLANGFSEYFIPMIVEPNLSASVSARFYGFHMDGEFAHTVSEAFRNWHGMAELRPVTAFPQIIESGNADDFELLEYGFAIDLEARPMGNAPAFDGQIWLLTDSGTFTGVNHMYLKLALQAGFNIIYEENPYASGWDLSFSRLPNSRIAVRYNPLYFTDDVGRAFEEFGAEPTHRLAEINNLGEVVAIIQG